MKTKLTLRVDDKLIVQAKRYAHQNDKSVSQIVEEYFSLLPLHRKGKKREVMPLTQSLKGAIKNQALTEEDYKQYLKEKYR